MEYTDIRSLSDEQLRQQLAELGVPGYRAQQIRSWLDRGVSDFSEMANLPQALRNQLSERFSLPGLTVVRRLVSAIDDTTKYLCRYADGETIETVLMKYKHGWSQCLSTQVGCRMNCSFCATGMGGLVRNLTPSEMMAQIETAQRDREIRVSSIVLMGMGEPLDNYENVLRFLHILFEEGGIHIGQRHVSLSTCGIVDKIYKLMEEKLQLTLSVSLHAPNNEIRSQLMPVNRRWPVEQLLEACRDYIAATGRRISFEYALIDGVNDSDACANELAAKLKGMLAHVNLIPANAVPGKAQRKSSREQIRRFQTILEQKGIAVTVRRTLGSDINASCGQLRRGEQQRQEES